MYFVEVRSGLRRNGPPNLVSLSEVDQYTGFRSVCCFPLEVANLIRTQKGTANLRGQPVYADTLFMDFDGHDPIEFRAWLIASGLGHTEWNSGGRSVHFHIPMVPALGVWVPAAMKAWTKKHAPSADTSFLHAAGMYRLPGTYHAKHPGRRKELVHSCNGRLLELFATESETIGQLFDYGGSTKEEFFTLLMAAKGEGQRAPFIWRLATVGAQAGLEFFECLEHIRWWNAHMASPPRDDLTVVRQCESAYRRLARRLQA